MKVYKYMSPGLAEKFIEKPLLRLTPAFCLNDPFEVSLPKAMFDEMENFVSSNYKLTFETEFNQFMLMHGIISLTTKSNNLLMWSHYAQNHEGLVVEINVDENNVFSIFNSSTVESSPDASFCKVQYSENRNMPDKFSPETIKAVREFYYSTKYSDWKYEDEYRYICPFSSAKFLRLDTENKYYTTITSNLKIERINKRYHDIHIGSEELKFVCNGQGIEFHKRLLDVWLGSKENGAIFLVELSDKAIGSLFIGANANVMNFDKWIKQSKYYNPIFKYDQKLMMAKLDLNGFAIHFGSFNGCDKMC